MDLPAFQGWRWLLFVCLSSVHMGSAAARPQYMVVISSVLEAGSENRFCASLLQPNETLLMTVTLFAKEGNMTLLRETTDTEFRRCVQFKTPAVLNKEVQNLEVLVKGKEFELRENRKVMIKAYRPQTFIQTDKPIYLPGQTVKFRVLTLDSKFRSVNELYKTITVESNAGNRIGQWLNATSDGKILQLSYTLNSEAPVGVYRIDVWNSEGTKSLQHFKVEKYVLPRFEVKVKVAEEISVDQEEVNVEVCATYTYGQPVPATAEVKVMRPIERYTAVPLIITPEHPEGIPAIVSPSLKQVQQLNNTGCAPMTFSMSPFTKTHKVLSSQLSVMILVTEEGTGIAYEQAANIQLSYMVARLSFVDTPKVYEEGQVLEGKVKAVYFNDTAIPNKELYLFEGERWGARLTQNLTTDASGVATFSLNTTEFGGTLRLTISSKPLLEFHPYKTPHYNTGEHTISLIEPITVDTKTASSLEVQKREKPLPCDTDEHITVKYTFVGEAKGPVDVMYLVLSRGAIVKQGFVKIENQDGPVTTGEMSFKLRVSPEMAPLVQVVAYALLPSENVVAHAVDFDTDKCFVHKVSVEFSPDSAVPGEKNTLHVSAEPGSLCGVSAVDQSVLIKAPGKKLDTDKVFELLPVKKLYGYPYEVSDAESCLRVRTRRYVIPYPGHDDSNAYAVFESAGLKMFTNMILKAPHCLMFKGRRYYYDRAVVARGGYPYPMAVEMSRMNSPRVGMDFVAAADYHPPPVIETVRTFFPETWIWDLVEIGESGANNVALTVPDTITTWETEAFCLSQKGFGLAPRKEIKVFQPFFLELSLPYSIIRGEHFELKATVFNYLSSCIMVTVSPALNTDYTLTLLSEDQVSSCLCANSRKVLRWKMTPSAIGVVNVTMVAEAVTSHTSCDNEIVSVPQRGRVDVVTRSLIVKSEGIEKVETHNLLLCPKGEALKEEIELRPPENVIAGSARASLSVLGDILGRALKNLNGLLRMPYGCGEQNMALLAPNIYILEYLTNTEQLTTEINKKATQFLSSGYQRQLNYRHNGAYSTFGTGPGNTWLTAFVLRSFVKAMSFVYIDPAVIDEAKTWLQSKQIPNGCFQSLGGLFNNRMKGGVSDETTLSAYVTAALLETNMSVSEPTLKNSLSCLKDSLGNLTNTYSTALLAYVFTLAGDMETRALLLQHLEKEAVREGGVVYWAQTRGRSISLSVEISSYVLLATLGASPTNQDLGYASRIVRWLTTQQNSYGGFSSTQDTVVALQALAHYSTLVYKSAGASIVTVQFPSGQTTFEVNQNNKLLYQERELKDVMGKYSLEVKGSTCTSMQLSLFYNIPTPTKQSAFNIQVTVDSECNSNSLRPKLTLKLQSSYTGSSLIPFSNMVIVDIKMLSGFVPDPESLTALKSALLVNRVEQDGDHVIMYLEKLPRGIPVFHNLKIVQDISVQDLKPAVVKIYDYYQTSDQAETEYTHSCASGV